MRENQPILVFDKPQFEVKLHPDVLTLHVKEGAVREFDKLAEQTPHVRDSLRWMFHEIIPLKVRLQTSNMSTLTVWEELESRSRQDETFTSH